MFTFLLILILYCENSLARIELTTALDLLSILSPITDPPTVDPLSLPLISQTLTLISTLPSSSSATSTTTTTTTTTTTPNESIENININLLPIATSLSSIKSSANSFFTASELLLPSSSSSSSASTSKLDPFPPLLSLLSSPNSSYTIIPIGAQKGATISSSSTTGTNQSNSSNENKFAKSLSIFYGAQEANERFRYSSFIKIDDVLKSVQDRIKDRNEGKGKGKGRVREGEGRIMVVIVKEGDKEERAILGDEDGVEGDVELSLVEEIEKDLKNRARSIFSEELFASVSSSQSFLAHHNNSSYKVQDTRY